MRSSLAGLRWSPPALSVSAPGHLESGVGRHAARASLVRAAQHSVSALARFLVHGQNVAGQPTEQN